METNNIDKIVRDSLKSRTVQPSNSAWERLSDQLEAIEEPKRINWFKYAGYAASILLIISVAFFMNSDAVIEPVIPETIVTSPKIDTDDFVKPTIKNTAPTEIVIVKSEKASVKKRQEIKKNNKIITKNKSTELKVPSVIKNKSNIVIANNSALTKKTSTSRIKINSDALLMSVTGTKNAIADSKKITIPDASKKFLKPSKIQINSDALLYAVSNPDKDISEYYKKYKVDRNEILKNIQRELKKVNLNIDARTLLTDVEKSIDEETFKKSFMQVVKGKITGLASAISNRNN